MMLPISPPSADGQPSHPAKPLAQSSFERLITQHPEVLDFLEPVSLRQVAQVSRTCTALVEQIPVWRRHVARALQVSPRYLPQLTETGEARVSAEDPRRIDTARFKDIFRGLEVYNRGNKDRFKRLYADDYEVKDPQEQEAVRVTRQFIEQYLLSVVEAQKALKAAQVSLEGEIAYPARLVRQTGFLFTSLLFSGACIFHAVYQNYALLLQTSRSGETPPVTSLWVMRSTFMFCGAMAVFWLSLCFSITPIHVARVEELQRHIRSATQFWSLEMLRLTVFHNIEQQRANGPNLLAHRTVPEVLERISPKNTT